MKKRTLIITIILLMSTVVGCTTKEVVSEEPKVLRIYAFNEDHIRREYVQLYEVLHPEVELQFINRDDLMERFREESPDGEEGINYEKMMQEMMTLPDGPDVIISHQFGINDLIKEGLLTPLDPMIEKSNFDLEGIGHAILEGIRDLGDGSSIYALSPTFYSGALYYNKKIFDELDLPYPQDGLTYEDVFNLARQISLTKAENQYYGFSFGRSGGDLYDSMMQYADWKGLSFVSKEGAVTINTPEWEEIWSLFAQLYHDKVIPAPEVHRSEHGTSISYGSDFPTFGSGRVAMSISDGYELAELLRGRPWDPNYEPFEWDLASLPVNPETPDFSKNSHLGELMGINVHSQNYDLAWEFISFLNGERVAKVKSASSYYLVSRPDVYKENPLLSKVNMEAFYLYKPEPTHQRESDEDHEGEEDGGKVAINHSMMSWELRYLGGVEFDQMLMNEKTVKQALADLQRKAEEKMATLNQ